MIWKILNYRKRFLHLREVEKLPHWLNASYQLVAGDASNWYTEQTINVISDGKRQQNATVYQGALRSLCPRLPLWVSRHLTEKHCTTVRLCQLTNSKFSESRKWWKRTQMRISPLVISQILVNIWNKPADIPELCGPHYDVKRAGRKTHERRTESSTVNLVRTKAWGKQGNNNITFQKREHNRAGLQK